MKNKKTGGHFFYAFILLVGIVYIGSGSVFAAGENLISNPDFETVGTNNLPTDWIRGRWGTNTVQFDYPAAGMDSSKAAKVTVSQYTNGDAKWAFKEVLVTPGQEYEFSDHYISNVQTHLTVQFRLNDGTFVYRDMANLQPSAVFAKAGFKIIIPENVKALTVFHLINRVGFLTVDRYNLTALDQLLEPAADSANLVKNPSLESVNIQGQPSGWQRGRWGQNDAEFSYPVQGNLSNRAARVEINSYSSGDAKWYFDDVAVDPGVPYEFTDFYKSNIRTQVTVRFRLNDNSFTYFDIGSLDASSVNWQMFKKAFTTPAGAVSLSVFHVIKGVGYLEVDSYSIKRTDSDPDRFAQGLISLNFDDGWKSVYDNAIPILDEAGFKSTQYIISERLSPQFPGYVRPSEVLDMQARGHEIGAHSRTHPDLSTLSEEEARNEIQGSRNDILGIGATPVNFFAYPLGGYNDQVKRIVRESGFMGGRSSDGGFNLRSQDKFALRRYGITSATTFIELKTNIDKALADKTWLILLFHEINNTGNTYSMTPELFQQVVDYLKEKNVTPVTMQQAFSLMN